MRTRVMQLMAIVAAASVSMAVTARADYAYGGGFAVRDVGDFYEPLAPFGYWVETDRYGWCWYPAYVDSDWRPYGNGNWSWSDQGWYWVSDEPWAWACYHYGRWVWDSYYGWLWVPGTEWAPSWVSWREGGGYVGWAPLTPECEFNPYSGAIFAEQIVIAPQYFVFVQVNHFCDRIRPAIICNNPTVINQTVNITKIKRVDQVVINQGPSVGAIERVNPGKVVKVHAPRPMPAKLLELRQARDNPPMARGLPEVIRGTPRHADASVVTQPMRREPPADRVIGPRIERPRPERPGREDRPVRFRELGGGDTPPRPAVEVKQSPRPAKQDIRRVVVAQPQALPVVADNQLVPQNTSLPPQAESGNGRKLGQLRRYGQPALQDD